MKIETNDQLSELFAIHAAVFEPNFYKFLEEQDDVDLKQVLNYLEDVIKTNNEQQAYSMQIKNNLYNLLSVYRKRYKDENMYSRINNLISLLNSAGEANAKQFLENQFYNRFLGINGIKKLRDIKNINIYNYEEIIYLSIANDINFWTMLQNYEISDFIKFSIFQNIPLSNLLYLLNNHSELLNSEEIKIKILSLLIYNYDYSGYEFVDLMFDDEVIHYDISKDIKVHNNICLKKMKKLKLDR